MLYIINQSEIKGFSFLQKCIKEAKTEHDAIIAIVDMYNDNKKAVYECVGLGNLLRCHAYYINQKLKFYEEAKK